jgi:ABC-type polysaccharide/polyol phosphate transport system ATPase subunit
MSLVKLTDVFVEIPLRGVTGFSSSDPRFRNDPLRGPVVSALRGISLEINPGDRIGLMGANGAGKSTLLRVIAGMIPITAGSTEIKGDVYGIFNIADGVRMSLTGRENARLRHSLLGESSESPDAFIEGARAFADLGDFFELPVSSYSPGMLSRLMFAMSTVSSSDILLLDEWIGVADRVFQEKAAHRLRQLVNANDIVIIASHDPGIIREMTNRVIILDHGRVSRNVKTDEIERL